MIKIGAYLIIGLMPIICGVLLFEQNACRETRIKFSDAHSYHIKSRYYIYSLIVCLILFIFSTARSCYIGADYINYVNQYLKYQSWYNPDEFGFSLLYKITYYFFGERYWGIAFFTNAIVFSCLYNNISKYTKSKFVFFVYLVFVLNPYMFIQSTFNIIRQGCMAAILSLGVKDLADGKYLRFVCIVLIASTFHSSAIIFSSLILLSVIKLDKIKVRIIATLCFLLSITVANLDFLNKVVDLFGFGNYIGDINSQPTLFNFKLFSCFVYAIILLLTKYYDNLFNSGVEKKFVDIYIVSLCYLLVAIKSDMFYRLYITLVFVSLPAIEIIFRNYFLIGGKEKYLVYIGYGVYYVLLYLVFLYSVKDNGGYIPYNTFLNFSVIN